MTATIGFLFVSLVVNVFLLIGIAFLENNIQRKDVALEVLNANHTALRGEHTALKASFEQLDINYNACIDKVEALQNHGN